MKLSTSGFAAAHLFDVKSGQVLAVRLENAMLNCVACSPAGNYWVAAAGSERRGATVIRVSDNVAIASLPHSRPVTDVCFSPDEGTVATVCEDGTARVWKTEDGTPLTPLRPGE